MVQMPSNIPLDYTQKWGEYVDTWEYSPRAENESKKREIFLYTENHMSLHISMSCCTISLCVSIKGQQRSSWSLFRTFPC